jgi:hypothetical protein
LKELLIYFKGNQIQILTEGNCVTIPILNKTFTIKHELVRSRGHNIVSYKIILKENNTPYDINWYAKTEVDGPLISDRKSVIDLLENEYDKLAASHHEVTTKLSTINSKYPDVWSFYDFLYFSTITQGTVGYGDIIPNSTLVRSLVTVQILTSYLVLVVLINWVFKSTSRTREELKRGGSAIANGKYADNNE